MIRHENIFYTSNLPFSAQFVNLRNEPVHCHREIEILLMLRGFARYKIYHMDYALLPGDLIIADVEDLHRIHDGSEDALMLQVHLDTGKFEEIYPNISTTYFVCEDPGMRHGQDASLLAKQQSLRHQLSKLMMDTVGSPEDFALHADNINEIVETLVGQFRGFYMEDYQYRVGRQDVSGTDLDRMSRITGYLLENYDKKISLEDVSAIEHLNIYYISHLVKKTLGIPFQQFLNGVRLEFAEKNLLFTNDNLTRIAENCGFSSLNYFNKCFHQWYGETPAQYRKSIPGPERQSGAPFTLQEGLNLTGGFLAPVATVKKISLAPELPASALAREATDGSMAFSPTLLIRTQEDLMGLGFLRERIQLLKPAGFLVNQRLVSPMAYGLMQSYGIPIQVDVTGSASQGAGVPAGSTAAALAQIVGQSPSHIIPLIGAENALFLPEGLAAPHYTAYQILAGASGKTVEAKPETLVWGTEKELAIVLYNQDPRAILNVRLVTKKLPEQFFLMKKQIPEENNCYTIRASLGHPSFLPGQVLREIDQSHLGLPHFVMVDREASPVLDFMVYPLHVTMLVVSSLASQ
jgi:AraC-like DNA-binding protein